MFEWQLAEETRFSAAHKLNPVFCVFARGLFPHICVHILACERFGLLVMVPVRGVLCSATFF